MLITEAQMNINKTSNILDEMVYLSESVYAPAMVPIVENTSVKANLIRLEDLLAFSEANGIEDLGHSMQLICEASQVDPSTIAFSVDETSLVGDDAMTALVEGMMNDKISVFAAPISKNHLAVTIGEAVLDYTLKTGDTSLFEAYCLDEEVKHTNLQQDIAAATGTDAPQQLNGKARKDREKDLTAAFTNPGGIIHKNPNAPKADEKSFTDKITQAMSDAKDKGAAFIRGKIVWLHRIMKTFTLNAQKENAPIWKKLIGLATRALAFLTGKLKEKTSAHNAYDQKGLAGAKKEEKSA